MTEIELMAEIELMTKMMENMNISAPKEEIELMAEIEQMTKMMENMNISAPAPAPEEDTDDEEMVWVTCANCNMGGYSVNMEEFNGEHYCFHCSSVCIECDTTFLREYNDYDVYYYQEDEDKIIPSRFCSQLCELHWKMVITKMPVGVNKCNCVFYKKEVYYIRITDEEYNEIPEVQKWNNAITSIQNARY
jgi:predicted Zn-ribbon and HTH transcriptional regulator